MFAFCFKHVIGYSYKIYQFDFQTGFFFRFSNSAFFRKMVKF